MTFNSTRSSLQPGLDPSSLVGVRSIDQEHYDLVSQLEYLKQNSCAHPRSEAFSEILSRLGLQISAHFDNEEKILKSFEMPANEVQSHVQAHNEILGQYAQLNLDLMAGKALSQSDVLVMIKNWVIDHVLNHDLRIRNYVATC